MWRRILTVILLSKSSFLLATTINVPDDYSTIQAAINAAQQGDTVLVQSGIYAENINFNGKNIVIASLFLTTSDTSYVSQTVIDGGDAGRVITITNGESNEAKVIGFTIQNGNTLVDGSFIGPGAGIYISGNSSPIITNNIIQYNSSVPNENSVGSGGGISCSGADNAIIENNIIRYNEAFPSGGGIMVWISGQITVRHNLFYGNSVILCGDCTSGYQRHGGGLRFENSDGIFQNNTLWNNLSNGVDNDYDGNNGGENNIVERVNLSDPPNFKYCMSLDDLPGNSNITGDPLFVNEEHNNYNLQWGSPAIDSGDPTSPLDVDNTQADIGAYSFDQRQIPSAPQILDAIPGDSQVTLIWKKNSENDFEKYFIYGSTFENPTIKIDSTISINDTSKTLINLTIGTIYYFRVTTIDTQGYESTYSNEVSSTPVDLTPPSSLLISPLTGTQLEIGSTIPITWSAVDNVEVTSIDLRYSVDGGDNWSTIATNEDNDSVYYWSVPNTPSEAASIQLIAYDTAGLSDTSTVIDLAIVIAYPRVIQISPPEGILTWRDRLITISLSHSIDPNSVTLENIVFNSNYSSQPILSYSDLTQTLTVGIPEGFASLDSITITLKASGITNIYGYQLDGNGDGSGGDDLSINYSTTMLADYDSSGTIDVIDLSQFIQGWEEEDFFFELGPVSGTPPHFISSLDSVYNIEDLMGFVMMWNWYVTHGGSLFRRWVDIGKAIEINYTHDSISFELPKGTVAYELQVKYDPTSFTIQHLSQENDILLTNTDEEEGNYLLLSTRLTKERFVLPITVNGRETDIFISLRAIGYDRIILSQLTKRLHISSVPNEYTLFQNCPNPFNPITQIEYNLPKDGNVSLIIYDLLGRQIKTLVDRSQSAGNHDVTWNGKDEAGIGVGTGLYIYRLQAGKFTQTRKMLFLQ